MAIEKRRYLDVMLGLFVAIGIALLATLIFLIGKERRVFDTSSHVQAYFANVAGLAVGADVMLAGVTVGHVSDVIIPTMKAKRPTQDRRIRVVMRVSRDVMPWLRQDSVAHIDSKGLLGDKTINISLGSPDAVQVKDGGTLQSMGPLDINDALKKAQVVLDNLTSTAVGVRKAIEGFEEQGGGKALAEAVHSIRNIASEIEKGKGAVHNLIYDNKMGTDFKDTVVSLKSTSSSVAALMAEIKNGDGLLHTLVYDKRGQDVIKVTQSILDDINSVLKEVHNGSGILHGLVYASSHGNMIASLNQAAADLQSIMASVKNGDGTLGRLVVDSSVYDDLKQILGRVKRNEVLKALVRYSISR